MTVVRCLGCGVALLAERHADLPTTDLHPAWVAILIEAARWRDGLCPTCQEA